MDQLLSLLDEMSSAGQTLTEEKKKLAASLENLQDEGNKKGSIISQSSTDLKADKSRETSDVKLLKSRAALEIGEEHGSH